MSTLREAAQQALEALEEIADEVFSPYDNRLGAAILALREALAEPEQEPVAWMYDFLNPDNREEVIRNWVTQDPAEIEREKGFNVRPLYTAPPQRKPHEFIGLDLKEMDEIIDGNMKITDSRLRDAVYAVVIDTMTTLMEKNSG